jgi:hypothetical protein
MDLKIAPICLILLTGICANSKAIQTHRSPPVNALAGLL